MTKKIPSRIARFIELECTLDPTAWTHQGAAWSTYSHWDRYDPLDRSTFLQLMRAVPGVTEETTPQGKGYRGIQLDEYLRISDVQPVFQLLGDVLDQCVFEAREIAQLAILNEPLAELLLTAGCVKPRHGRKVQHWLMACRDFIEGGYKLQRLYTKDAPWRYWRFVRRVAK